MRGGWWLLLAGVLLIVEVRAARPTVEADVRAAEAIVAADRLALQGDQSGAVAKYRTIVRLYPQSYSAPKAQLQIADLLAANREHAEAFAAYQELIDKFPASSLFTPAIEGQFAIAQRVADSHRDAEEKGVKPPRSVPDRAALTAMLRQILGNGRHVSFSSQIQYQLAVALDRTGESKEAIGEFWRFLTTYPEDPRSDDAAFQIAFIEYRQARQSNREQSSRVRAIQALDYFLVNFSGSEKVPEASHLLGTLQQWGVSALQGAGDLYRKTGNAEAALRTYQEALQQSASEAEADRLSELIEKLKDRPR